MEKITKTAILICAQILLVLFFLGFSEYTKIGATVIFPIGFSITFFFLVLFLFDINFESKKQTYLLALFIGGIALFSTAIGFHYSADAINNLISGLGEHGFEMNVEKVMERIYHMDEYFSHWIMYAGILMISGAIGSIYYFSREEVRKKKSNKVKKTENRLLDIFVTTFAGSATGVISCFLAISGNVLRYSLITVAIILPIYLIKTKNIKLNQEGLEMIIFGAAAISAFISLAMGYYLVSVSGYIPDLIFN